MDTNLFSHTFVTSPSYTEHSALIISLDRDLNFDLYKHGRDKDIVMHFKGDNESGLEENIGTNSSNCIDYSNNKTNNTLTNVIKSEILK